jgi:hypothetical protein
LLGLEVRQEAIADQRARELLRVWGERSGFGLFLGPVAEFGFFDDPTPPN